MKILLDTHTFIWWIANPSLLSRKACSFLEDQNSELFLSIASVWEIAIKANLGKLELREPIEKLIPEQLNLNSISLLPIQLKHIFELSHLAPLHKDPFDRLLIAQSRTEKIPILSNDHIIKKYGAKVLW